MGKALVFEGITITNPLQKVQFSDGLSTIIRDYKNKLVSGLSDTQAKALESFYEKLRDAGLWDSLDMFYPMYGSVSDCSYGVVGKDITIPNGAVYNKGLDLTNASGSSVGAYGTGILLKENWNTVSNSSSYTLYYNCDKESYHGDVITSTVDLGSSPSDNGRYFGPSYKEVLCGLVATADNERPPLQAGVCVDAAKFGSSGYTNTVYCGSITNKRTNNRYGNIDKVNYLSINGWCNNNSAKHKVNAPINMIMVFMEYHDESKVQIVMNAINELKVYLF